MDAMDIYWLTRLPALHEYLSVIAMLSCVVFTIGFCILLTGMEYMSRDDCNGRIWRAVFKKTFLPALFLTGVTSLGSVLCPDREDLAIILAGSYVVNNEEMSNIPDNAAAAINKFLKDYSEEKK